MLTQVNSGEFETSALLPNQYIYHPFAVISLEYSGTIKLRDRRKRYLNTAHSGFMW